MILQRSDIWYLLGILQTTNNIFFSGQSSTRVMQITFFFPYRNQAPCCRSVGKLSTFEMFFLFRIYKIEWSRHLAIWKLYKCVNSSTWDLPYILVTQLAKIKSVRRWRRKWKTKFLKIHQGNTRKIFNFFERNFIPLLKLYLWEPESCSAIRYLSSNNNPMRCLFQ